MYTINAIRILFLEDNPDDIILIERELRKDGLSFEKVCVDTREEFIQAIRNFRPDVVLSDHGLPQFNSREALKICQAESISAPFILVTGTVSEEFAISSLRNGAHDYILKSSLNRLPSAIRRAIKEKRMEALKLEATRTLQKQNDELIKANQELDSFVYSVSHNLRGPLASVLGLLNVAKLEHREKKMSELHSLMEASVRRLDDTLKEILDYSQNARKEVQFEKIDWEEIIHSCFEKLEYLSDKPINKVISLETDIPFYSDYTRVNIIINNLLSNAIIFQDKSRELIISIEILVTKEMAALVIKDNGIGIHESCQPKIFDMFFRGSNRSQGAGLGLYIVKEVIARLDGKIQMNSEVDSGTTVIINLPNNEPVKSNELRHTLS